MKKWIQGHKKIVMIITPIVILCSVLIYMVISKNMNRTESQKITFTTLSKMKRSDIQLFGDKNQYVLAPNNAYLAIGKNMRLLMNESLQKYLKEIRRNFK